MSECKERVEDMLGAIKESPDPNMLHLLECCGGKCSKRKYFVDTMQKLKPLAANCKTRSEYVAFLQEHIAVGKVEETADGMVLHLGKTSCSCPMIPEIQENTDMLCECTKGSNIATWSAFFGKPVKAEIQESILRGGNDCVIKIIF